MNNVITFRPATSNTNNTVEVVSQDTVEKLAQETVKRTESVLCNEDLAHLKRLKEIASIKPRVSADTYKVIDSETIANNVFDYLTTLGYDVTVKIVMGASKSSSKHIIEFTLNNMELFKDSHDAGNGKVLILNSYNGECSLTVIAGMIRFACANGIISGEKEFFEKLPHRQYESTIQRLDNLNDKIRVACEWLTNTFEVRVNEMKSKVLTYEQECSLVFKLKLPAVVSYEVLQRRHPENKENVRIEDQALNIWTLFNVINEVIREKARHAMHDFDQNETLMHSVIELSKVA